MAKQFARAKPNDVAEILKTLETLGPPGALAKGNSGRKLFQSRPRGRNDLIFSLMENLNKDSHDEFLGFSRITCENWLAPDRNSYPPFGISAEQWIKLFLEPRLEAAVPQAVIKLFEVARAAMIYSWFFCPLATLGQEQCLRIADSAIRERCLMLPQEPGNFCQNIAILTKAGVISGEDEPRWHAVRKLRNARSHPESYMQSDPGQAAGSLHTIADLVNSLFLSAACNDSN